MGVRGGASQGVGVSGMGDASVAGGVGVGSSSLREKEQSARERARRSGATVYAPLTSPTTDPPELLESVTESCVILHNR